MEKRDPHLFRFIDARELKQEPVLDLNACRLAVRAYWWNVAQGEEVSLLELYRNILKYLHD